LWKKLNEVVEITSDNQIAVLIPDIAANELILISLSTALLGHKIKKFPKETLSREEIFKARGMLSKVTYKSIMNRIGELVKERIVEGKNELKISEVAARQFIKIRLDKLKTKIKKF